MNPPTHGHFSRSFFKSISQNSKQHYLFENKLQLKHIKNCSLNNGGGGGAVDLVCKMGGKVSGMTSVREGKCPAFIVTV